MKKVCIILPTRLPVPTVLGGAVETLVEKIIDENEHDHQYDFTVITIFNEKALELSKKYKYTRFLTFTIDTKQDGINNLVMKICRKILRFKNAYTLEAKAAEKVLMNEGDFDYVLVDGGDPNMVFLVNKYYPKSRILLHIHGGIRPAKRLDRAFKRLISVSDYISDVWMETAVRSKDSIEVLKNCADISKFSKVITEGEKSELRNSLGLKKDDFVIMFTGRIIPEKGVKELIQAINQIEDKRIALLIIGSSNFGVKTSTPYEQEIQRLISESDKKIIFTGYIHNSELYKYHQISDIAVVPSMWEDPAPLVPIEAMASGRPLIVTRSGGMPEYVTEDCAVMIEKDENVAENLAKEIVRLKNSPEMRAGMSKSGRVTASQYDVKNFFSDFCKIIEGMEEGENS